MTKKQEKALFMTFVKSRMTGSGYNHSLQVASKFPVLSVSWKVAILHDILEDKGATFFELESFLRSVNSEYIMRYVCAVTRLPEETYFTYIRGIKRVGGIALDVKRADLAVNLSRTETLKESLKQRYLKAIEILDEV